MNPIAFVPVLALVVGQPVVAPPAPPAPPLAPPPAVVTAAKELPAARQASHGQGLAFARVYVPADRVRTAGLAGARTQFQLAFDADPQSKQMEQRYPGSRQVAMTATEAAVGAMYDQRTPVIQDHIATFITRYFTDADLAKITAFTGSPTGQAIQRAVGDSASLERMSASARDERGAFKLDADDVTKAVDPGFLTRLSPDQLKAFATFNTSPPGWRFNQIGPTLLQLVAAETTAMVNEGSADVQVKVMQAVADHIRGKAKP